MGQTLSEPVLNKQSSDGGDENYIYGVSSMQGWRINMEDGHTCILDLKSSLERDFSDASTPSTSPPDERLSFFAVFDGHGGERVAIYSAEHLHSIIAHQDTFLRGDYEQALKDGFLAIDVAILNDPKFAGETSGSTASVALITKDKIYVGNAGDSRTVLGIKGVAKPLSFDHKPLNEEESARIRAAGGSVDFGRVNGNLALSRAIGDFEFKKSDLPPQEQIVTVYPEVTVHEITSDDEFIVLACDGIWDCQSSQSVVEFVRRGIAERQELHFVCENLINSCVAPTREAGVGCDNMTVIIVGILNGLTKDQWYDKVAERVAQGDGPCGPVELAETRQPVIQKRVVDPPGQRAIDMDYPLKGLGWLAQALGAGVIFLNNGETDNGSEGSEVVDVSDDDLEDGGVFSQRYLSHDGEEGCDYNRNQTGKVEGELEENPGDKEENGDNGSEDQHDTVNDIASEGQEQKDHENESKVNRDNDNDKANEVEVGDLHDTKKESQGEAASTTNVSTEDQSGSNQVGSIKQRDSVE